MTKPAQILLATHNPKKVEELKKLLEPIGFEVLSADDISFPETEETGKTFTENALLKATDAASHTGLLTLSDDSGLCVDALDGNPGIFTARYGGYEKLLDEMKDIPFGRRTATFKCVLALATPEGKTETFEGVVNGFILTEPRGLHGFAYDPVFLPEGEQFSFAEMLPEQKNAISHRYKALQELKKHLESL